VERCTNCQFYDRHGGNGAAGKSSNGGQCRRHAPQLAPNSSKQYLIEGVWPTVRDEDWCGEFKASGQQQRRPESTTQRADALLGAIGTAAASAMSGGASTSSLPRVGAAAASPASIGMLRSGNGSD
jgi:hypothetical protein